MKIFCIARNYIAHAEELANPVPKKPVIFMKPQSAILRHGMPFIMPDFSNHIDYETEVVIQVSKNGKAIQEEKAGDYFRDIGIGIDFTARDLQAQCKEKGHPWEIAKSFDKSAPVSSLKPISDYDDINNLAFSLKQNDEIVQQGNTKDMIFSFNAIIAYISKYFTLNIGDLIFTGTPVGVGKISKDDKLQAYLEDELMLSCEVK